MFLVGWIFLIFLGLLLSQEIFRRFPKFTLAFFIVLPIILITYLIDNKIRMDWFSLTKIFSVTFAIIWFSIFRLTSFGETKFAKNGIYLILVINIFEAIAKDVLSGGVAHYFNAAAGILSIITLNKINSINTTKDKNLDVNWEGMTLFWIIGNTIWDWTFIYLNYPSVSAHHIAVLGAPLIIAFFNKGRWLQARVLTLGAYLFFLFLTLNSKFIPHIYSISWGNKSFGFFLAFSSLVFMIIYTIFFLRSKRICG
ncbi:MAG TPA: DUF5692 family protein [Candidatus Moranbacteria bacterium]|nr:DUF5692 family protein [Candidatus Moranbacteria bacterium]